MTGVALQVDARGIALVEARAAGNLAAASATHLAARAGHVARAAVQRIAGRRDARAATTFGAGGAHAARVSRADLARGAGRVAVAAVLRIARRVCAGAATVEQAVATGRGANLQIAHLAGRA